MRGCCERIRPLSLCSMLLATLLIISILLVVIILVRPSGAGTTDALANKTRRLFKGRGTENFRTMLHRVAIILKTLFVLVTLTLACLSSGWLLRTRARCPISTFFDWNVRASRGSQQKTIRQRFPRQSQRQTGYFPGKRAIGVVCDRVKCVEGGTMGAMG